MKIWCSFYRVQRNWAVIRTVSHLNPKYDTEMDLLSNNITKAFSVTSVGFNKQRNLSATFLSVRKFIARCSALVLLYVCVPYTPDPAVQQSESATMESILSWHSCTSGFNLCVNFFVCFACYPYFCYDINAWVYVHSYRRYNRFQFLGFQRSSIWINSIPLL
jgi:hypothetical protein